ncbi:hypothetical protein F5Y13DRAFT_139483 [Hypoxylon sp. FL1857]|nr:hypothetical protein F5Y13DRAFT_139483 [Hypoxylon sp. FL1857]
MDDSNVWKLNIPRSVPLKNADVPRRIYKQEAHPILCIVDFSTWLPAEPADREKPAMIVLRQCLNPATYKNASIEQHLNISGCGIGDNPPPLFFFFPCLKHLDVLPMEFPVLLRSKDCIPEARRVELFMLHVSLREYRRDYRLISHGSKNKSCPPIPDNQGV